MSHSIVSWIFLGKWSTVNRYKVCLTWRKIELVQDRIFNYTALFGWILIKHQFNIHNLIKRVCIDKKICFKRSPGWFTNFVSIRSKPPSVLALWHWNTTNEPCREIMVLFVLRKLILQTCMRSHPVGLEIWFLVGPFVYFHTSCVRTAKAGETAPEPSLVAYVISTIISWAESLLLYSYHSRVLFFCQTSADLYSKEVLEII